MWTELRGEAVWGATTSPALPLSLGCTCAEPPAVRAMPGAHSLHTRDHSGLLCRSPHGDSSSHFPSCTEPGWHSLPFLLQLQQGSRQHSTPSVLSSTACGPLSV